jgi:hypothetical protein
MKIIDQFLQESNSAKDKLKEYKKKAYDSNGYKWAYTGGKNYGEQPLHNLVWNANHPKNKVKGSSPNLIHHKDGNKQNNAISNLEKVKKVDHDKDHLTKRRKEMPSKFSKKTSSKGGKNAIKKHPELKNNLKH